MGLFDMFTANTSTSPAAAPTPAAPAPVQPGNLPDRGGAPAPATPGTEVNGVVPAPVVAGPEVPDSPLAQFEKFWDTVPNEEGNSATPVQLDQAKLQEVISKADFTGGITPEDLAAVTAGGEGAAAAFTKALNTVAQQVILQSTMASNKMQEQSINAAITKQAASIPELIRAQSASNTLQAANPLFSNPAVKPIIEAMQVQLLAKNPNATPAEVTTMAQDFVSALGESFAPKAVIPAGQPGAQVDTTDWTKFLEVTQ